MTAAASSADCALAAHLASNRPTVLLTADDLVAAPLSPHFPRATAVIIKEDSCFVDIVPFTPSTTAAMDDVAFGSFTQHHRESYDMAPFDTCDETELQELYAAHMRAAAFEDDIRSRFDPPPVYQVAQYASHLNQINYTLINYVLREPGSGALVVTVDRTVALQLESVHGYTIEPFHELRTLTDVEARVASLSHVVTEGVQSADAADEAGIVEALAGLVDSAPVSGEGSVPAALSSTFRTDVMGTGPLRAFQAVLFTAVEERCTWRGRAYAPLCDWAPSQCKQQWRDAAPAEVNRWEQAVLEMRQAYCLLRMHALGESVWGENGVPQGVSDGTASWTAVRKLTKAYFRVGGGNDVCHSACRDVVRRVHSGVE